MAQAECVKFLVLEGHICWLCMSRHLQLWIAVKKSQKEAKKSQKQAGNGERKEQCIATCSPAGPCEYYKDTVGNVSLMVGTAAGWYILLSHTNNGKSCLSSVFAAVWKDSRVPPVGPRLLFGQRCSLCNPTKWPSKTTFCNRTHQHQTPPTAHGQEVNPSCWPALLSIPTHGRFIPPFVSIPLNSSLSKNSYVAAQLSIALFTSHITTLTSGSWRGVWVVITSRMKWQTMSTSSLTDPTPFQVSTHLIQHRVLTEP